MPIKRDKKTLLKLVYINLGDASRLLTDTDKEAESVRRKLGQFKHEGILPCYYIRKSAAPYFKFKEIERIWKACQDLKSQKFYVREYKDELLKKAWYRDLMAQTDAPPNTNEEES